MRLALFSSSSDRNGLLKLGVIPLALENSTLGSIVCGIMTRGAQWRGGNKPTANGSIEGIPIRGRRPTAVTR